jgi:hypothetical protein
LRGCCLNAHATSSASTQRPGNIRATSLRVPGQLPASSEAAQRRRNASVFNFRQTLSGTFRIGPSVFPEFSGLVRFGFWKRLKISPKQAKFQKIMGFLPKFVNFFLEF